MTNLFTRTRKAQTVPTAEVTYEFINGRGRFAVNLNGFIKQAKKQGVKIVGGAYKYDSGYETVNALNVTFAGPERAVLALGTVIDQLVEDSEAVDRYRSNRRRW